MKILLRLFATACFFCAVFFAFLGGVYDGPYGASTASDAQVKQIAENLTPAVKVVKDMCYGEDSWLYENGDSCDYAARGLAVLLPTGVGLFLLSLLLSVLSVFLSRAPRAKALRPEELPPSAEMPGPEVFNTAAVPDKVPFSPKVPAAPPPAAAAEPVSTIAEDTPTPAEPAAEAAPAASAEEPSTPSEKPAAAVVDESELEALEKQLFSSGAEEAAGAIAEEELGRFIIPSKYRTGNFADEKFFLDINKVIALAQSTVDEEAFQVGVAVLRPEFMPHLDKLDDKVRHRVGRQMMQHHAMLLKRSEKGISPSQFASQDRRMGEVDRETICRRFMPKNPKTVPSSHQHHIGKIYVMTDQNRVQQDTASGADDWQDISLRTLVSVVTLPLPS